MNRAAAVAAFLLAAAVPVAAQTQRPVLTDSVIVAAIDLYNRPATIRITGDSDVAAGTELVGDVAVVNGVFEVSGRIRGSVLLINGRLQLRDGAEIAGDVTVIGGTIEGRDSARIAGHVSAYRETFSFQVQDDQLVRIAQRPTEFTAGRDFDFGRTDIVVASRRGYNRVEGLPINVGPRLTLGRSNPTIIEALFTFRTAAGFDFDSDDWGYAIRAEQFLGGLRAARLGLRAYSEIVPIENGGMSDPENSLAAFLFHHDYRDHYEREGWNGYFLVAPPGRPTAVSVGFAEEWHRPAASRDPVSIIDNGAGWRAEPLAATGRLRAVFATLTYDTRNVPDDPSDGWWARIEGERGVGGTLAYGPPVDLDAPSTFTAGAIDLRRYARLGPGSRLAIRLFSAGSVDGKALPVQRQRALGGEGTLPGFTRNQFDCDAEDSREDAPFKPFYGCDRVALVQIEHQGEFGFLRRADIPWLRDLGFLESVRWVAFFDAGRAWTEPGAAGIRSTGQNDFAADAGFGIRLGKLGLYWAFPLSGSGNDVNFFLRLGPRL